MKNDFLNKIQTVQISSYVIWANKCISNVSRINQSCVVQSSEWVCYHVLRWHTDILQEQKRSQKACQKSSEKTSRKKSLSQIRKMWILQTTSQISKTHCHDRRVRNEFEKNQSSDWISHIRMCQKHTNISETSKILSKIHHKLYQHHCITH